MFNTIFKVFTCRKTSYNQISAVAQKIVHSVAHGTTINIAKHVLAELSTKLTMPLAARGTKIFFPRILMCIDKSKTDNSKAIH